jgi:dolichol-phosphate mannosyltransferase
MPNVTIIVPPLNKDGDMAEMAIRIRQAVPNATILVTDNSADIKAAQVAREAGYQIIPNTRNKGFAYTVIEGIRSTPDTDNIVVMDGDARLAASVLPKMVVELERNEMVVVSRRLKNKAIPISNRKRSLTNRTTSLLAWPLARRIKDRTSGFLGFRKSIVDPAMLSPNSTMIGLEIMTRGRYTKAVEVPYPPVPEGQVDTGISKISLFPYLKQLFSLYMSKFQILNFMIVGGIGYIINMGAYWLLLKFLKTTETTFLGQHFYLPPFVISTLLAIISNYELNKYWTFKGWGEQSVGFLRYLTMGLATMVLDMAVLWALVDWGNLTPILAAAIAIAIVFIIRYLIARKWIWARK